MQVICPFLPQEGAMLSQEWTISLGPQPLPWPEKGWAYSVEPRHPHGG